MTAFRHLVVNFLTIALFLLVQCNAKTWGFEDATLSISGKKDGVGGGLKEKISEGRSLANPVSLKPSETLKVLLTVKEDKRPRRPHQAFLTIEDSKTKLDTSFPFVVKENGKGKVELAQKDIPVQLLATSRPLAASIVIASFGTSTPYLHHAFDLKIETDPSAPFRSPQEPLRYGKLPEIHHVFKADPKNPPKIITLVFTAAVIAALPALFIAWVSLGANINHTTRAFKSSPISHAIFFSSVLAMEGIFFMYYTSWNLFQTLPGAAVVGLITFLSGSRALREVQGRRLAGLR
ncbi:MAG: hypothetical protein Q9167_001217 [Letrouitia subvulpina]